MKHRNFKFASAAIAALMAVALVGTATPAFAVGPNVMNANVTAGPAGNGVN